MSLYPQWTALPARAAVFVALLVLLSPVGALAIDSAVVVRINGAPTQERAGTSTALREGTRVSIGDVIVTDAAAKVKLTLADDSVLAIGPRSRVTIDRLVLAAGSRTVTLRVLAGRFRLAIAELLGGTTQYEIYTPTALAGVRGTVLWGDTELDAICALDGHIEVRAATNTGAPAQLTAGECVSQMAAGKTVPLTPSPTDLSAYLKEVTLE